jgi:hypothetical protein
MLTGAVWIPHIITTFLLANCLRASTERSENRVFGSLMRGFGFATFHSVANDRTGFKNLKSQCGTLDQSETDEDEDCEGTHCRWGLLEVGQRIKRRVVTRRRPSRVSFRLRASELKVVFGPVVSPQPPLRFQNECHLGKGEGQNRRLTMKLSRKASKGFESLAKSRVARSRDHRISCTTNCSAMAELPTNLRFPSNHHDKLHRIRRCRARCAQCNGLSS